MVKTVTAGKAHQSYSQSGCPRSVLAGARLSFQRFGFGAPLIRQSTSKKDPVCIFDILRIFVSREIPYDATEKVARRQSNLPGYFGSGGKKPSLCSSKSYQAAFFDQMLSSGQMQRSLLVSSDHAFGFPSLLQLSSLFLPDRERKN